MGGGHLGASINVGGLGWGGGGRGWAVVQVTTN